MTSTACDILERMTQSEQKENTTTWWKRNRAWVLCIAIPFVIFFAAGAKVGWGLIDKDAGRWLRDNGTPEPASDFYYAAGMTGLALGAAGGFIGIGGYGCYKLMRRMTR